MESGIRTTKRMRKGTRSCKECRRRKIRCTYTHAARLCTPCLNRGETACVEQGGRGNAVLDPKGFALCDALDVPPGGGDDEERRDDPPWLLALRNSTAVEQDGPGDVSTSGDLSTSMAPKFNSKESSANQIGGLAEETNKYICSTLRQALPTYDDLISIISQNGAWWDSFRQKTDVITQLDSGVKDLATLCEQKYTSRNPAELGILVTAYARCRQGNSFDLYQLVNRLIISDFTYLASIAGMECLVLLAKAYTDMGQPRRAWMTWRRGMSAAEMMGWHRTTRASPSQTRLWWTLYHGDRFTSMFLGLPYGFSDAFHHVGLRPRSQEPRNPEHEFIHGCAVIGGKVIERNVSNLEPSFDQVMQLQEQLETTCALLPKTWWKLKPLPSKRGPELDRQRDCLLQQFYYFHIGMYVHLPSILGASSVDGISSPARPNSQTLCVESARQMLMRYVLLRTEVDGAAVFECKTSDFIAFTAAVVCHLGLSHATGSTMTPATRSQVLDLVTDVIGILQKLEQREHCKIAYQCCRVLELLTVDDEGLPSQTSHVSIPFFGTIVRRRHTAAMPPNDISRPRNQFQNSESAVAVSDGGGEIVRSTGGEWNGDWRLEGVIGAGSSTQAERIGVDESWMGDMLFTQSQSFFDIDQEWFLPGSMTGSADREFGDYC